MSQRLYRTSDQADFQTYPAPPDETARLAGVNVRSSAPLVSDSGNFDKLKDHAAELTEKATTYASDFKDDAMAAGSRWIEQAQDNARRLANRSRELSRTAARDYPLHVILGAAAVGLAIGIGLRVWRQNRV